MPRLFLLLVFGVLAVSFQAAFAVPEVSLDKESYVVGDSIHVSGNLSELQEGMFVLLQVRSQNDIVALDQFIPSSESFSKTMQAVGPKWSESGTYTIVVSYLGKKTEKTFQFSAEKRSRTETSPEETPNIPQEKPPETQEKIKEMPEIQPAKPLISIRGFPDLTKSPNYYYERYHKETKYKQWFDSIFVGYTPSEVVGYPETHISGFPDPAKSPQYYIDRYNNEAQYRKWFDLQFPENTIEDIVVPSTKFQNTMPAWVRTTAGQWSSGQIQDDMFVSAIKHLIDNDVIHSKSDLGSDDSDITIPEWVKNNAGWWADGLITENDFLFGIEELLRLGIITV